MVKSIDRYALLDKVIRISNSTVDIERRLTNLLHLFQRDMGVSQAYIFNMDREGQGLILRQPLDENNRQPSVRLNLDDNFVGLAAVNQTPVMLSADEAAFAPLEASPLFTGFVYLAAFPIMDDQIVYGVLVLLHREETEYSPENVDLIQTIVRELAGTIRNSRLYKESKKRIAELSVLYELSRKVSTTLDLDHLLDTVVNLTARVLSAGGCSINVLDTVTNQLRISAESGYIPPGCRLRERMEAGDQKAAAKVLACVSREEPYLGPAWGDPYCDSIRQDGGDQSIICLPLHFKGQYKGTLGVYNKIAEQPGKPNRFTNDELELLTTMGAMVSGALEKSLTFQRVDALGRHNEHLLTSLTSLYEISGAMMTTVKVGQLLNIISNALTFHQGLGFDRALIMLVDEERKELRGAAMNEARRSFPARESEILSEILTRENLSSSGLASKKEAFRRVALPLSTGHCVLLRTVREQRPFNVKPHDRVYYLNPALPAEFGQRGFAAVPMQAKSKVVGVIAVDRDFSGREISDEDMRNLTMLAAQAGLALENSQLYEYIENANIELSRTRERLLEAEKLAALGEMAAGMAHEIRNPLVSIGGFTRRVMKSLDKDSPLMFYIEVIMEQVARLEKTLNEVLDFSRDSFGHFEEYNLNDVLNEALYVLRRDVDDCGIEVVKDLAENIPPIIIDERQIKHVFFNLFYNACQAMGGGGVLNLKTFTTVVADRTMAAVEFSDSGPGISPEAMPNIFNPFFTTKDTGTGLGLSIVHKIVTRHHGEVDVYNLPTGGASFTIKLPVAAESGLYLK